MADPLLPGRDDPAVTSEAPAPVDYKSAGVDIDAGHEAVRRIRALARGTFTSGVLSEIGSFGGLFRPDLVALRKSLPPSRDNG